VEKRKILALFGLSLLITGILSVSLPVLSQELVPSSSQPQGEKKTATYHIFDQALNFLPSLYAGIRGLITSLLEQTLLKEKPELAGIYAEAITFLTSLTALYVILEFFSLARKIVLGILLLGWGLFVVTLVVRTL